MANSLIVEIRISPNADTAAEEAAGDIAAALRSSIDLRGRASLAVSGGSTAPPMLASLADSDLAWELIEVWQVDERIVPDGDPDRNANQLSELPATVHLMPVAPIDGDVDAGAARYAESLPDRFDVVHLGLGSDGHTASWPPDQTNVADAVGRVVLTDAFNGRRRMTVTAEVVNAADRRVVLAVGSSKSSVVARWIDGDASLPISKIRAAATTAYFDASAASGLV